MKYFSLFVFLFGSVALAQLDPSASRLLRQGSADQSLESSRYQVKPKPKSERNPVQRVRPTPVPTPAPTPSPVPAPKKEVVQKKSEPISVKVVETEEAEETRIHYSDPRLNLVEVSFAPGAMYINSKSQSWYRDYFSFSPSINIDTRVWITPAAAIRASYGTSLAADISSSPTNTEKTATEHRSFGAGIEFRHYASASRKSPSYTAGIGYDDYQMILPRTETERVRLSTKGLVLSLAARLPTSVNTARLFSIELMPKLNTKEESTQVTFKSGELDSAHGVRIGIGSEYIIDRKQQFYWQLYHRVDKHIYEGASSANDPITGSILSGVSVTTGTTQFQFGFSWGD